MNKIRVTKMEIVDGVLEMTLAEPINSGGGFSGSETQLHRAIDRCQDIVALDALAEEISILKKAERLSQGAMDRLEEAWETRDIYLSNLKDLQKMRKR